MENKKWQINLIISVLTNIHVHKSEIVDHLKAANEKTPKRFAYRFEFKDGKGAGTWIANAPSKQAKAEFTTRFSDYEIEVFQLINWDI